MAENTVGFVYCPACWWQERVFVWDGRRYGQLRQHCPSCGSLTKIADLRHSVDDLFTTQPPWPRADQPRLL